MPNPRPLQTTEEEPKKERRRRIHFKDQPLSPTDLRPMTLIRHGWEAMLYLDAFGGLTALQLGKLLFWTGMVTPAGYNRLSLQTARAYANRDCLAWLKKRGHVDVQQISEYLDPGVFSTLRRQEICHLTVEGKRALVEHMNRNLAPGAVRFKAQWKQTIKQDIIHRYDIERGNQHAVLAIEGTANFVGWLKQYGGEISLLHSNAELDDLVTSGETLLGNIQPDGLVIVEFPSGPRVFFLEFDTGSQDHSVIQEKAVKYGEYYANRYASDPFFAGLPQPQTLFVTNGKGVRVQNLVKTIAETGGRRAYAVTTLEWITPPKFDACKAVWSIPTMSGLQTLFPKD